MKQMLCEFSAECAIEHVIYSTLQGESLDSQRPCRSSEEGTRSAGVSVSDIRRESWKPLWEISRMWCGMNAKCQCHEGA